MVSEKVGGAEGTKLDEDFKDLERVRDLSIFLSCPAKGLTNPSHSHCKKFVQSHLLIHEV